MKTLISIIVLLALIIPAIAQRPFSYSYTEVNKSQFDSCNKVSYLIVNTQIKKQAGKLTIPISGKSAKVFKDDSSDKNFHEFEYLGDIKTTKLSLVKRTDYNSEEFYLINCTTGTMDTLIGQPVFAENMLNFACINIPGADEKQKIQVGEIRKGSVNTIILLKGKADTFLEGISCINRNSILTKDNKGKYWKLNYTIGGE